MIQDPRICFFGRNMPGSRSSISSKDSSKIVTKDESELNASKIAVRKSYQDCNGGNSSCLFCGRADGKPFRISMAHLVSSGVDDYSQLNARAKACLKEFVDENLTAEISTLKSVTSLLVKTQMTDAFSNDVSQISTRTQSIDDGDEIEDAGDKSEKSVV